ASGAMVPRILQLRIIRNKPIVTTRHPRLGLRMDDTAARQFTTDRAIAAGRATLTGTRGGLRGFLPFVGPAVIASVASMDPGNFAVNIEAGASFGYLLLGVVLMSNFISMLLKALSANYGVVTSQSLSAHCRRHFARSVVHVLWVVSEIGAMATDLAEFLG